MARSDGQRGVNGVAQAAEPGGLSALLKEIAHGPDTALGDRWELGLRPGAVVGRFELVREIGRGGFGVVYEARDRELGRTVAFKAVRAGARTALRGERLLREAEAVARLSHPNLVVLHDVGRCEFGPYLVLELLRGQTLADRLAQGPLGVRESLRIAVEVAKGVAHAHEQGVVHRDLKPANVFLCEDGQVKVLDFGLAHALGRQRAEGGTPAYMAPEQWKGAPEDERTDVFALGVILFRMLAGELPFPEDDQGAALLSSRPAPTLEVPEATALEQLVARALQKDPVKRPRDGAEMLSALSAFQRELERTPSAPSAPVRTRRRPAWYAAAAVASAVLLAAAAGGLAMRVRRSADPVAGERVTVAVADFANETGEPELNGLSGMLITSLEQSRRLSVLTRVRMLDVLRQLGRASVDTVDEALGREVALKAGVRALVLATIRRFDQLYAIEVKVLDPVKSEYLFTLKEEGRGKASVPAMIDRLSETTRERLRETPAEVRASQVKVADATTASFEAYQHYFRGDQLKEAIRYEAAVEEYRKAIAIDPTFALPHYRIAYLGEFLHMDPAARRAEMEAALRYVDRVPAKERFLFQAWKAHMDGRNEEAHALYARVLESYPEDKEALFMAGDLYLHETKYAEALPYFERAVLLDPYWEPAMMHVVDSLVGLGRSEELMRRSREWAEKAPGGQSFRALCLAYGVAGRPAEALAAARRYYEIDRTAFARAHLFEALIFDERYEEAETLARQARELTSSKVDSVWAVPMAVMAVAYQGRRREVVRLLDEAPPEMGDKPGMRDGMRLQLLMGDGKPEPVLKAARALAEQASEPNKMLPLVFVLFGDPAGAAELAKKLPAGPERDLYEGAAAWKRGEADRAATLLRTLAKQPAEHESRGPALWMLAQIAMERGREREAISAVDELRLAGAGAWRSWAWPQSLYLKARAHERLGEPGKARETLDHLLGIWKRADPDLPLLADARAMRNRLGGAR